MRCVATWCRLPSQHAEGCHADTCSGCLPRLAAAGLRLCQRDLDLLGRNAQRAAEVYPDLIEVLVASGQGASEVVAGTRDRGLRLNPRAVKSRAAIEDVLASWCQLVVDERGHQAPIRLVPAMADYIGVNAEWLAAHPAAEDCADELRELAVGEPWRVAYPARVRTVKVGACPVELAPEGEPSQRCGGELAAVMRAPESLRRSEIVCAVSELHRWHPHQWLALRRQLDEANESPETSTSVTPKETTNG